MLTPALMLPKHTHITIHNSDMQIYDEQGQKFRVKVDFAHADHSGVVRRNLVLSSPSRFLQYCLDITRQCVHVLVHQVQARF